MMGTVLYGDMIIAHQLITVLGEKRSFRLLAFLEQGEGGDCAEADDHAAFMAFLHELELHFGPDLPALRQLRSLDQLRM